MFNPNPGGYPNFNLQPQYPQFNPGFKQNTGYNQFVPSTNKNFVRSLEEALSLPADFNSQNVYFDINDNVLYDICTNGRGEKSWAIFTIAPKQTSTGVVATPNEDPLEKRMKALETKMEEILNGQYNVKQTDATNQ